MKSLTLFSPAKINLFLRVLGKRSDGYHNLASLFQAIDLGDILTISFSEKDTFSCSEPSLLSHSNLVVKALHLFREKTRLKFNMQIHLEKRIPMQAGLGGGSSNAATTLWGLNALHGKPVEEKQLQTWSSEIGSDVPFFFSCGTAYCQGRGEIVENLPDLPHTKLFTLIKPQVGLSTAQIFKELKLTECSDKDPEKILETFFTESPLYVNDLELPAFRLFPFLIQLKHHLTAQGKLALMTGSGTTFFSSHLVSLKYPDSSTYKVRSIWRDKGKWFKENETSV